MTAALALLVLAPRLVDPSLNTYVDWVVYVGHQEPSKEVRQFVSPFFNDGRPVAWDSVKGIEAKPLTDARGMVFVERDLFGLASLRDGVALLSAARIDEQTGQVELPLSALSTEGLKTARAVLAGGHTRKFLSMGLDDLRTASVELTLTVEVALNDRGQRLTAVGWPSNGTRPPRHTFDPRELETPADTRLPTPRPLAGWRVVSLSGELVVSRMEAVVELVVTPRLREAREVEREYSSRARALTDQLVRLEKDSLGGGITGTEKRWADLDPKLRKTLFRSRQVFVGREGMSDAEVSDYLGRAEIVGHRLSLYVRSHVRDEMGFASGSTPLWHFIGRP